LRLERRENLIPTKIFLADNWYFLHLAASKPLTEKLVATGCTSIAYETISVNGHLSLLEPMSEIAGRMSSIVGSYHLANHRGGRGILLGGVPGVAPGRAVVIGGGTAGVNAARVAAGIGADVTILKVDFERMRFFNSDIMPTLDWSGKDADVAPSRWRPYQRGLKSLPVN
jgi:alanine dehydrogenase